MVNVLQAKQLALSVLHRADLLHTMPLPSDLKLFIRLELFVNVYVVHCSSNDVNFRFLESPTFPTVASLVTLLDSFGN